MTDCWNCHRPSRGVDRVCAFCGAAVLPSREPEPAPPPVPLPKPRERGTYTLVEPGKPEAKPRRPGLVRAVRADLRAAAALVILICVVALVGVNAEGVPVQRPRDPASSAEAAERGLFVSTPVASPQQVAWGSHTVTLEDAWIAEVERPPRPYGAVEEPARKRHGRLRLYFRLASSGPPDFEVLHGPRASPVTRVDLEHGGRPVVVYHVDLFGYSHPPELITLRSRDGSASFTLN